MMRKFLAAMSLAISLPVMLSASVQQIDSRPDMVNNKLRTAAPFKLEANIPSTMINKGDKVLGKYNLIEESAGYTLSFDLNPVAYEPKSKTYVYVGRAIQGQDPSYLEKEGVVYVSLSNDNGNTWSDPSAIHLIKGEFMTMPSFSVSNPANSSDPATWMYQIFGRYFKASNDGQNANNAGFRLLLLDGASEAQNYDFYGPESNNPSGRQEWSATRALTYTKDNNTYFVNYGTLYPKQNSGAARGYYGLAVTNMNDLDIQSYIPSAWDISKFRPAPSSTYNNPMYMSVDNEGTLYAAVNNMFKSDINKRKVGVSKSSDNGKTWSEFEEMPQEVINNFVTSQGGMTDSSFFMSYDKDAFVVYGVNKMSYFTRMYIGKPFPTPDGYMVVEIHKDGTNWGIRKVTDIENRRIFVVTQQYLQDPAVSTEEGLFVDDNDGANELEVAITAAGDKLVIKYIDVVKNIGFPQTTLKFRNQNTPDDPYDYNELNWDTLATTDIFITSRSLASSQWANPVNVTNDDEFNHNTYMPLVVEDDKHVPIISKQFTLAYLKGNNSQGTPRFPDIAQLPDFLASIFQGFDYFGNAVCTVGSMEGASVNDNEVASISEVYPNPTSSNATVKFNVANSGNVSVRVYNAMGAVVSEIANANFEAGNYTLPFSLENFANGTYYVTVNANGSSSTRVLNVIK